MAKQEVLNLGEFSEDEIREGLKLLTKKRDTAKGRAEKIARNAARNRVLLRKAIEANIPVSEDEITAELKR
jgi:hypothetical protein